MSDESPNRALFFPRRSLRGPTQPCWCSLSDPSCKGGGQHPSPGGKLHLEEQGGDTTQRAGRSGQVWRKQPVCLCWLPWHGRPCPGHWGPGCSLLVACCPGAQCPSPLSGPDTGLGSHTNLLTATGQVRCPGHMEVGPSSQRGVATRRGPVHLHLHVGWEPRLCPAESHRQLSVPEGLHQVQPRDAGCWALPLSLEAWSGPIPEERSRAAPPAQPEGCN